MSLIKNVLKFLNWLFNSIKDIFMSINVSILVNLSFILFTVSTIYMIMCFLYIYHDFIGYFVSFLFRSNDQLSVSSLIPSIQSSSPELGQLEVYNPYISRSSLEGIEYRPSNINIDNAPMNELVTLGNSPSLVRTSDVVVSSPSIISDITVESSTSSSTSSLPSINTSDVVVPSPSIISDITVGSPTPSISPINTTVQQSQSILTPITPEQPQSSPVVDNSALSKVSLETTTDKKVGPTIIVVKEGSREDTVVTMGVSVVTLGGVFSLARQAAISGSPSVRLGAALTMGVTGIGMVAAQRLKNNTTILEGGLQTTIKKPHTVTENIELSGSYGEASSTVSKSVEKISIFDPQIKTEKPGFFSRWFGGGNSNKNNFNAYPNADNDNNNYDDLITYLDNWTFNMEDIDSYNRVLLDNLSIGQETLLRDNSIFTYFTDKVDNLVVEQDFSQLLGSEALMEGYDWLLKFYMNYSSPEVVNANSQLILIQHLFILIVFFHLWGAILLIIMGEQLRAIISNNSEHRFFKNRMGKILVKFANQLRFGNIGVFCFSFILFISMQQYRLTLVRAFGIICKNWLGGD